MVLECLLLDEGLSTGTELEYSDGDTEGALQNRRSISGHFYFILIESEYYRLIQRINNKDCIADSIDEQSLDQIAQLRTLPLGRPL